MPRNLCNCEIVTRQKQKYFSEKFAIFVINYKIDHYGIIIAAALCIKKQYRMTKIQTGNWDFEGWEYREVSSLECDLEINRTSIDWSWHRHWPIRGPQWPDQPIRSLAVTDPMLTLYHGGCFFTSSHHNYVGIKMLYHPRDDEFVISLTVDWTIEYNMT